MVLFVKNIIIAIFGIYYVVMLVLFFLIIATLNSVLGCVLATLKSHSML